jgi:hypothetical protein
LLKEQEITARVITPPESVAEKTTEQLELQQAA